MTTDISEEDANLLWALNFECDLTVAVRGSCECGSYFYNKKEVIIPEVLRVAKEKEEDPVDLFADFARRVHARHMSGKPLST